jgi:hypothetical protein
MTLGPKLAYWGQSLDPSWFIPFLGYFDLTKSVSIPLLSFHRRNQLFVKYLRYLQRANVGVRFPLIYSRVRSQSPEVLVFYVIKGRSLAGQVANQFLFCDKSWACELSKHCTQRINLYLGPLNENHAKMLPQESFFQSIMISN